MLELRRRFRARSWRLSEYLGRDLVACGAMTPSAEASGRAPPRTRLPDFFIVGHAKSGTTALYEMLRRHPQMFMPELQGAVVLRERHAPALHSPVRRRRRPRRSRSTSRCSRGRARSSASGEASSSYLWSRTAAAAIADVQPGRAHHRDPARAGELPALAAPAAAANHLEVEQDFRKALALEQARREGRHIPRRSHRPQLLHLLRPRALRRAAAPLPRAVRARADAGADLRRLPRRQRGHGARVLRFLGVDEGPIEVRRRQPHVTHALAAGRRLVKRLSRAEARCGAAAAATEGADTERLRRSATRSTQRAPVHGAAGSPTRSSWPSCGGASSRRSRRSASTWSATSSRCGAMTTSTEPRTPVGTRAGACPPSSSSGTPRAAPRPVRDAQAPSPALPARLQGAQLLRGRPAPALQAAHPASPKRSRSTCALFEPRPRTDPGGGLPLVSVLARGRRRDRAVAPDARIIAILREPASFLHSLHLQLLSRTASRTAKDLAQALALEPARREGREIPPSCYRPQALFYSERVRYVEQLRRYHEVFAPEQVLVLIYDDFRTDNAGTVRRCCGSSGSSRTSRYRHWRPTPALPSARCAWTPSATGSRRRRRDARGAQGGRGSDSAAGAPGVGRAARRALYESPQAPDERLMRELRVRFQDRSGAPRRIPRSRPNYPLGL